MFGAKLRSGFQGKSESQPGVSEWGGGISEYRFQGCAQPASIGGVNNALNNEKPRGKREPESPVALTQKVHGPRYFRTVWAAVLEQFYGNEAAAEKWMTSHCPNLGGKPIELVQDADG